MGECRNDLDICNELARRPGTTGYNDKTVEEWLRELTGGVIDDHHTLRARRHSSDPDVDRGRDRRAISLEPGHAQVARPHPFDPRQPADPLASRLRRRVDQHRRRGRARDRRRSARARLQRAGRHAASSAGDRPDRAGCRRHQGGRLVHAGRVGFGGRHARLRQRAHRRPYIAGRRGTVQFLLRGRRAGAPLTAPSSVASRARRRMRRHLLIYAGLVPFVVVAVFPVFWMAITAFKEEADLYRMDLVPFWFHSAPTLKNFRILFTQSYFPVWFVNTMLLSICLVTITLVTAVPAAYALARLRLPGAGNLGITMFMSYLVPPIIIFLPLARVVGTLGLFDSWWALVLVYPTFTIPFCTWLLTGFFKTLPREIEEASWLDGCGLVSGILRIVLPLTRPGIARSEE